MMAIARLGLSAGITVPVVLSASLLAGCGGSAPKTLNADQVGQTLLNQVYKLLDATTATDIKIIDALFDKYVPCANDKVKLTYAVSVKANTSAASYVPTTRTKTKATPKQVIDDLIHYVPQVGSFTVAERSADGATVKLLNTATRTRLTLHVPATDRLMISGETDCLRAGNLNRWPAPTATDR